MNGIFVSYRREDASGYAGRLADDLAEQFPRTRIFRDVESIEVGSDFRQSIHNAIASSAVCLVVIGPRWLSAQGAHGQPRLYDPMDFVRFEIGAALARGIVVIPVLVEATMPGVGQLPDDIKALEGRHAFELSDKRWDHDLDRLCEMLARVLGAQQRVPRAASKRASGLKRALIWAAVGGFVSFAALIALGMVLNALEPQPTGPVSSSTNPANTDVAALTPVSSPNHSPLSAATIAACTKECDDLARACESSCGGGNACGFCVPEGERCKELCARGRCNPVCIYNGRCQPLTTGDDPRDCCPPSPLNDEHGCAKLVSP